MSSEFFLTAGVFNSTRKKVVIAQQESYFPVDATTIRQTKNSICDGGRGKFDRLDETEAFYWFPVANAA